MVNATLAEMVLSRRMDAKGVPLLTVNTVRSAWKDTHTIQELKNAKKRIYPVIMKIFTRSVFLERAFSRKVF